MRKAIIIFISTIPFILFITLGIISNSRLRQQAKSAVAYHDAKILVNMMVPVWDKNDVISNQVQRTENLFSYQDKTYFYGAVDSLNFKLWEIDQQSGRFGKKIPITGFDSMMANSEIDALIQSENYLYILSTGDGGKGALGWVDVSIFDLNTNRVDWSARTSFVDNDITEFVVFQDRAIWQNSVGEQYFVDGEQRTIERLSHVARHTNSAYLIYAGLNDNESALNKDFWQQKLHDAHTLPIKVNDMVVVPIAELTMGGKVNIEVLDSGDQTVLFRQTHSIISNIVVDEGFVYFLTDTNYLMRTHLESSVPEKLVEFGGEPFTRPDWRKYSLIINQEMILVYLGDSQQIFAFQFID